MYSVGIVGGNLPNNCPSSGLWQDVAVSSPSEISPYDTEENGSALVFNVLISEHKEYKAPKIGQKY